MYGALAAALVVVLSLAGTAFRFDGNFDRWGANGQTRDDKLNARLSRIEAILSSIEGKLADHLPK